VIKGVPVGPVVLAAVAVLLIWSGLRGDSVTGAARDLLVGRRSHPGWRL
jgi:hypothetical protein